MATSPNFNWPEPDNTDLVKNGALAIRTAVDAIDTSMTDLLGGTTGQVLSKTSNTDMDFTWVTSDDANAIQNAIVDGKGDLIAASAADTPARLAVGANNTSLVANSSAATGLEWQGAWTTWTPTWSNVTIGNGVVTSRYQRIGNTVTFYLKFVLGTTSSVSNYLQFTLPFSVRDEIHFLSSAFDNSITTWYPIDARASAENVFIYAVNGTIGYSYYVLSGTNVPFTWATSDNIVIAGTYEVA